MDRVFAAGKSFKRNLKLFNRLTCGKADDSPWIAMCAIGVDPQRVVAELQKHGVKTTAQLKKLADAQCKKAMKNEAKFGESGMPREVNVVVYAYMFCEIHEAFGMWLEEFSGQAQVRAELFRPCFDLSLWPLKATVCCRKLRRRKKTRTTPLGLQRAFL